MIRRHTRFVVIVALALALVACATHSQIQTQHRVLVTLDGLVDGITAMQDAEIAIYRAHPCGPVAQSPCITAGDHIKVQEAVKKAYGLIGEANKIVFAWQPGEPVPFQVAGIIGAAQEIISKLVPLLPVDQKTKDAILKTYDAIATVARAFAGGV